MRIRRYTEGEDVVAAARSWPRLGEPKWWNFQRGRQMAMVPTVWVGADRLDPPRPGSGVAPQLYNLDAVAYESLMVGLFAILRDNKPPEPRKRSGGASPSYADLPPNEPVAGFSSDRSMVRAFHGAYGLSPRAYRQQHRNALA